HYCHSRFHSEVASYRCYNSLMQDGQDQKQPGWVFKPGEPSSADPERTANGALPPEPAPNAGVANADTTTAFTDTARSEAHVTWTASEYLANPKSPSWFLFLTLAALGLAVLVYVVTKDKTSAVVTVIMA